jgi:hypothetical protein
MRHQWLNPPAPAFGIENNLLSGLGARDDSFDDILRLASARIRLRDPRKLDRRRLPARPTAASPKQAHGCTKNSGDGNRQGKSCIHEKSRLRELRRLHKMMTDISESNQPGKGARQ